MLREALQTSWKIVPPVIGIPGIIGSILTVFTVTSRHCKTKLSSFTTYLGALAITDGLTIIRLGLDGYLFFGFGMDILTQHRIFCKILPFFGDLSVQFSACLVATLSVDRMLATYIPLRTSIHTQKIGFIVTGSIFGFLLLINVHELYGFTLVEKENITLCTFVDADYELFFTFYFIWVQIAVYWFLPILLIIGCNTAIVVKINRSVSRLRSTLNAQRRSRQLLRISILVSTTYVVLTTPATIYSVLRPFLFEGSDTYNYADDMDFLIYTIMLHLGYLNLNCNFFLYVLSGRRFRKDMRLALCGTETTAVIKDLPMKQLANNPKLSD